jgi:hypothetical protein
MDAYEKVPKENFGSRGGFNVETSRGTSAQKFFTLKCGDVLMLVN